MKLYRCYLYDLREHTVAVHSARHNDDDAAVRWAQKLRQTHPEYPAVDVWHGDKLVWRSDVTAGKQDG